MTRSFFKIFEPFSEVTAILSESSGGSMRPVEARRRFAESAGIPTNRLFYAEQMHGPIVSIVRDDSDARMAECDGLLTDFPDTALSIIVADCLPIYVYDPKRGVIGILHAGWRGLAGNIARVFSETARKEFGSEPEDFLVGIGPGIGPCHFEVGEEVSDKFRDYEAAVPPKRRDGRAFLNLPQIAAFQFEELGVPHPQIEISLDCTYCLSEKYFSRRRDGAGSGNMLAVICRKR
ncbi:peptidoglycan editing factor PgeF [Patescibacteria group bacterium]|nr:peptidoglycan editing factor PgeF [Patescibacteria group bacterium]